MIGEEGKLRESCYVYIKKEEKEKLIVIKNFHRRQERERWKGLIGQQLGGHQ